MKNKSMILLEERQTKAILPYLEEIVAAGNSVVFSFSNRQRITAFVMLQERSTMHSEPKKDNRPLTTARRNSLLH